MAGFLKGVLFGLLIVLGCFGVPLILAKAVFAATGSASAAIGFGFITFAAAVGGAMGCCGGFD